MYIVVIDWLKLNVDDTFVNAVRSLPGLAQLQNQIIIIISCSECTLYSIQSGMTHDVSLLGVPFKLSFKISCKVNKIIITATRWLQRPIRAFGLSGNNLHPSALSNYCSYWEPKENEKRAPWQRWVDKSMEVILQQQVQVIHISDLNARQLQHLTSVNKQIKCRL